VLITSRWSGLVIDLTAISDSSRIVGVTRNVGSKRRANSAGELGLISARRAAIERTATNTRKLTRVSVPTSRD